MLQNEFAKTYLKLASLLPVLLLLFTFISDSQAQTSESMLGQKLEHAHDEQSKSMAQFAVNLYSKLLLSNAKDNIVFSPFSIQTCAAMARIGAENETAQELERGLLLGSNDVSKLADGFHTVLEKYANSDVLKIANKLYVMKGYEVQEEFNAVLSKKFYSTAEEIDFAQSAAAASSINSWVESATNHLIKNLITPDALDAFTCLVLLNAIHFKGEWQHKFQKRDTRDDDFYLNEADSIKVPMMNLKERFRYANLPELDATAIELPYKNTDLSMLIILPNSRTGLQDLQQKLQGSSLLDISKRLFSTQVIVKLPKFKAEFQAELTEPFKQLGMTRMFTNKAQFGKMLKSKEELLVSKIIHKAFIDVNEEGTEAAAATVVQVRLKRSVVSLNPEPIEFIADHPFLYVINHAMPTAANVAAGSVASVPIPLFLGSLRTLDAAAAPVSDSETHDEL